MNQETLELCPHQCILFNSYYMFYFIYLVLIVNKMYILEKISYILRENTIVNHVTRIFERVGWGVVVKTIQPRRRVAHFHYITSPMKKICWREWAIAREWFRQYLSPFFYIMFIQLINLCLHRSNLVYMCLIKPINIPLFSISSQYTNKNVVPYIFFVKLILSLFQTLIIVLCY